MIIGFDLDNTLWNLEDEIKKVFDKHKTEYYAPLNWEMSNYPSPLRDDILFLFRDSKRMNSLLPFSKAKELIFILQKAGHGIVIITARDLSLKDDTIKAVEKNFGKEVKCIVTSPNGSKLDILLENNVDIWVDDCSSYLSEYRDAGIEVIMISNDNTVYNWKHRHLFYNVPSVASLYANISIFNILLHNRNTNKLHSEKLK